MADTEVKDLEQDDETDNVEEEEGSEEQKTPVRHSSVFFAQRRIIEKQKKQLDKKGQEESEDEDVELTPKARAAIQKELSPALDVIRKQSDDLELREYFADHPEMKKHEKTIRARMDAWKEVPVEEIAKTVAPVEERRQRKEEITQKARGNSLKGTSGAATESKLPTSQEDFKKIYDEVKKGRKTVDLKQLAGEE
jgi:hypothetical protein